MTSPEKILAIQPSQQAQEQADELMEKNGEGELTAKEQAELEQVLTAHRFMSLLKAAALEQLT